MNYSQILRVRREKAEIFLMLRFDADDCTDFQSSLRVLPDPCAMFFHRLLSARVCRIRFERHAIALGWIFVLAAVVGVAAASDARSATAPVSGFVNGPIVSVDGKTFVVSTTQVPGGKATVSIVKSTVISRRATVRAAALTNGVCLTATGSARKDGSIDAERVMVIRAVRGECVRTSPSGMGGRPPSANGESMPPPNADGSRVRPPGDFGFVFGAIRSVKGSTITIRSELETGLVEIHLSKKTLITKTLVGNAASVKKNLCVVTFGTSSDSGRSIKATNVNLTEPEDGQCGSGFPGRPRTA